MPVSVSSHRAAAHPMLPPSTTGGHVPSSKASDFGGALKQAQEPAAPLAEAGAATPAAGAAAPKTADATPRAAADERSTLSLASRLATPAAA